MERKTRPRRKARRRTKEKIGTALTPYLSDAALARLSLYSRYLTRLRHDGISSITSEALAAYFNVDAAQVRKDLSYIGKLGTRGHGYSVDSLANDIVKTVGPKTAIRAVVVGVGKLGSALIGYRTFQDIGIEIAAGFDADEEKIGSSIHDVPIYPITALPSYIAENAITMAALAVPGDQAEQMANILTTAGVKGIINFAPVHLSSSPACSVRNIDLSVEFDVLRYHLNEKKGE